MLLLGIALLRLLLLRIVSVHRTLLRISLLLLRGHALLLRRILLLLRLLIAHRLLLLRLLRVVSVHRVLLRLLISHRLLRHHRTLLRHALLLHHRLLLRRHLLRLLIAHGLLLRHTSHHWRRRHLLRLLCHQRLLHRHLLRLLIAHRLLLRHHHGLLLLSHHHGLLLLLHHHGLLLNHHGLLRSSNDSADRRSDTHHGRRLHDNRRRRDNRGGHGRNDRNDRTRTDRACDGDGRLWHCSMGSRQDWEGGRKKETMDQCEREEEKDNSNGKGREDCTGWEVATQQRRRGFGSATGSGVRDIFSGFKAPQSPTWQYRYDKRTRLKDTYSSGGSHNRRRGGSHRSDYSGLWKQKKSNLRPSIKMFVTISCR